tara:strand:+ start:28 stop:162 length:135 start_codon:yes stop_codon:yes gene_type:complete
MSLPIPGHPNIVSTITAPLAIVILSINIIIDIAYAVLDPRIRHK